MVTLTIDKLVGHLPNVDFKATRTLTKPVEIGQIAYKKSNSECTTLGRDLYIIGIFKESSSEKWLVHANNLAQKIPDCTNLKEICSYVRIKEYANGIKH